MEHPEESSDIDIFSMGSANNSLKEVKINNSIVLMQIDSGSEATICPKICGTLWENHC